MKSQLLALFGALAMGLLLLTGTGTGTAEARATRTEFTATGTCTTTSMGEVTFDDEGGMHIRGGTSFCISYTNLLGVLYEYVTFNMNLDGTGSGRVWLTSRGEWLDGTVVNEGTEWGEVSGFATMAMTSVLHGEGPLEGSLIFAHSQAQLTPTGSVASVTGYMLVP